ncbi:uncharacterized protein [Penaeus vannamei]|uniref:uncharacterized protein n=1 Tax=Penaeus vannamei TaxID=6689 RepID=UPI00387FA7C5
MISQSGRTAFSLAQLKSSTLRSLHTSRLARGEINVLGKRLNYEEVGSGDQVLLCLPGALGWDDRGSHGLGRSTKPAVKN